MTEYFDSRLAQLTPERAFEIAFSAYKYLRDMSTDPGSGTYKLLQKIAAGDATAFLRCYRKMVEEQSEADGVVTGRHAHPNRTPREDLINEAQQSVYWPGLVVVGLGTPYGVVQLPEYISMGFEGRHPAHVAKTDWTAGINGRPDEDAITIFRYSLVTAGNFLYNFNAMLRNSDGKVLPKDLADWDLKQMAERKYLHPFLRERGLLPASG